MNNVTNDPVQIMTSRLWSVTLLFSCFFLIILLRLYYLQIYTSSELNYLGQKNFLRKEKITSLRGNILDRSGKLLATNKPLFHVVWHPTGNKTITAQQEHIIEIFKRLLPGTDAEEIIKAERLGKKYVVARDVTLETINELIERFGKHPNITIETDFKRHYPHNSIACHMLGYIGIANKEIAGKMGLEKLLHEDLKGISGEKLNIVNSTGKKLQELLIHYAQDGRDVRTTLDLTVQTMAETIFPQEYQGTLLAINPKNGEILAMLSRPSFDPNIFLSAITHSMWSTMQENNPFINRCFEACYPPASLFKLVTVSAAIGEELITPETQWSCSGDLDFCGRKYHCHNLHGHGTLDIQEALAQSCNIHYYSIGKKIKINTLAHYAHMFGLGESTGIVLPEKLGLIPTSQWKYATTKQPWWPGETLSATIGQTYLLTTPAQALRMVAGIVEGSLVKFKLFMDEPVESRELELDSSIRSFLKESLKQVITKGTGRKLKQLHDIVIYGKTGTAQTSDLSKRELGMKLYMEHAWFVCHAQYKNYDPIAFIVFIENVGSSSYAKQVAYTFLREYCAMLDKQNA